MVAVSKGAVLMDAGMDGRVAELVGYVVRLTDMNCKAQV
jgi:hypothetical protein